MLRTLCAIAAGLGLLVSAEAGDLHLGPDRYWIALASRPSIDEAIAIARRYPALHPMVVRSVNGWYAVVKGPQEAGQGAGRAVLDAMIRSDGIPSDAYFTRGDGYIDVVWSTPASPVIAAKSYDGKTDATVRAGDLLLQLSSAAAGADDRVPILRISVQGRPAVTLGFPEHPGRRPAAAVTVAYLDPSSPSPQVVFTSAGPSSSCCTLTKIATLRNDGTWTVVDVEPTVGKAYALEHLSGAGSVEMTGPDQAFAETFGSRLPSMAPTRIRKLVADRIVDVTEEPQYRGVLERGLADIEAAARADDRLWHDNRFLAGWVAAKILVGQGPEAWSAMLQTYDRSPAVGPEECTTGRSVASCPAAERVRIDFPIALKAFLVQRGYMRDADRYPVPSRRLSDAAAAPAAEAPPAISRCVGTSDAARTLIYQSFVGRKIRDDESSNVVTLRDDTTVEAAEPSAGRVVCGVSYAMDLRRLIGRLAQDGEPRRAALLAKLMRRAGPTASNRIKYSIGPNVARGQAFVELLP